MTLANPVKDFNWHINCKITLRSLCVSRMGSPSSIILVGGDAEQVVVLEADSDKKGKVGWHGSIDNDDIVQTVIDLLEGGWATFSH